jgi:hypothetical protein
MLTVSTILLTPIPSIFVCVLASTNCESVCIGAIGVLGVIVAKLDPSETIGETIGDTPTSTKSLIADIGVPGALGLPGLLGLLNKSIIDNLILIKL